MRREAEYARELPTPDSFPNPRESASTIHPAIKHCAEPTQTGEHSSPLQHICEPTCGALAPICSPAVSNSTIFNRHFNSIDTGNNNVTRKHGGRGSLIWAAMFTMSILVIGFFVYLSAQTVPRVTLSVADGNNPGDVSVALQVLFLITVLALAPSILIMTTAFVRIIIVLSFLRRAIGTQSLPPDQLMVGLALFMTLFVMMPVLTEINQKALQPYMAQEIKFKEAVDIAVKPVRNFMLRQVTEKDVALFVRISRTPPPRTIDDLSLEVIIPAFITSELKAGFIIGFILFIPFLVIDMVVASVLLSMGMMMLPPAMISMPFKIILFVMVDGWHLIVRELVVSFR